MTKTTYVSFSDIDEPQVHIMRYVQIWVHDKKTPIPLKEIFIKMEAEGIKKDTIEYSIMILLKNGYIRRAINAGGNSKAAYVQLRRI